MFKSMVINYGNKLPRELFETCLLYIRIKNSVWKIRFRKLKMFNSWTYAISFIGAGAGGEE